MVSKEYAAWGLFFVGAAIGSFIPCEWKSKAWIVFIMICVVILLTEWIFDRKDNNQLKGGKLKWTTKTN